MGHFDLTPKDFVYEVHGSNLYFMAYFPVFGGWFLCEKNTSNSVLVFVIVCLSVVFTGLVPDDHSAQ